jgi:uncharacterized protein (DUF2147 family)
MCIQHTRGDEVDLVSAELDYMKASPFTTSSGQFAIRLLWLVTVFVAYVESTKLSCAEFPADITGVWLTDGDEGAIEILSCGDQRCGRIAWTKNPKDEEGHPLVDRNNHDLNLRSRPLCGLMIITGLKRQNDGSWGDGQVYDPEQGETYNIEIRRMAPNLVRVTGYLGFRFLGRTMDWQRAPKHLEGCGSH